MKILTKKEVGESLDDSELKGYLLGYDYDELVNGLGEPTYENESGDGKTKKEWAVNYKGNVYSIYDWKTWDLNHTMNDLRTWHIGGVENADDFIKALYFTLRPWKCTEDIFMKNF